MTYRKVNVPKKRAFSISEHRKKSSTGFYPCQGATGGSAKEASGPPKVVLKMRARSTGTPPTGPVISTSSPSKPSYCSDTTTSGHPSPHNLHLSSPAFQFEFRKLSVSCPLQFNGQLPDGVFNVRTSFQSRPSLIALGTKASSMTKFPVFVQTYSSGHPETDEVDPEAFERKDSALIIAPAPEERDNMRQFDFCQLSVLLCELLLLAGLLVFTFAISMKTSPSIHSFYTPHWAGVPLAITGGIGMGLHCRKWDLDEHEMFSQKFIMKCFILILAVCGIISFVGFAFSIYFFSTLVALGDPRLEIDESTQVNSRHIIDHTFQIRCIFNRSSWRTDSFHVNNSFSQIEFIMHTHLPISSHCENFLFNIQNYSLMQCLMLSVGVIISFAVLIKTLIHESFIDVSKFACYQTSQKQKSDKINEVNHKTCELNENIGENDVNSIEKGESSSSFSFSSSIGQRTDSFDSDATRHSSSNNNCFNRSRYRYYSNAESDLPGVIIESIDDIANGNDEDEDTLY